MERYDDIITLSKEEIKALNPDNTKITKNLASHANKIKRIYSALDAEYKALQTIVKVIHNHEPYEDKIVKLEKRMRPQFNKDRFIEVYGEDEYKKFCDDVEAEYVTFYG